MYLRVLSLCITASFSISVLLACGKSDAPIDAAKLPATGSDADAEVDEDAGQEQEDGSVDADAGDAASSDSRITYHKHIRPILESNCLQCHVEGGIGPMPLDNLQSVTDVQGLIVAAVEKRIMPPWPASHDCRDLREVRALTDEQIELFTQWRDDEFPAGDRSDYRAEDVTPPAELGEPDIILMPEDGYLPNTAIVDEYRCFITEGTFEEDTYLTAMDIRPGVRGEVHHVQVHKITVEQVEAARSLDDAAEGSGYPCTGNAGSGLTSVNMFSWRPGTAAMAFDDGDAALVEAGSAFVLQVHYNNQFLPAGQEPEPDQSAVAFWTLPQGELPDRVVVRTGIFAPVGPPRSGLPFGEIPAGESDVIGERTLLMTQLSLVNGRFIYGEIIGMTPHMHTLGTRLSARMNRADGSTQCLIDVPVWDFEWQLDYSYAQPELFAPEDSITVTCEYDNSAENQPVLDGERLAPRNVGFGEGSLDEMCLNYVWFRYDRSSFLGALAP